MTVSEGFKTVRASELLPQEEKLEVKSKNASLFIGIPKEDFRYERRIGLTPDAVKLLVNNGHRIRIETGAGAGAKYTDHDFSEAGAEICYDKKQIFEADLIFKVAPPTFEEIELMKPKQNLISAVQIKSQTKAFFEKLQAKKITALSFDYLTDEYGIYPVVRSMSEIAGSTSILLAAELLSSANKGKGLLLGGISGVPPTEVLILGAGNAGEFAVRAAMGMGASVKIFDNSTYRLRRLQNDVHARLYTCIIQPDILKKHLRRADVVIGAIRSEAGRTPCVVSEDMVEVMKPGSVLVDISIDQGGVFETSEITTHEKPTFVKHDVVHYCVPNIPSRVARTASFAISNIFAPLLLDAGNEGGMEALIKNNKGVRSGTILYQGIFTHRVIGDWFGLPYKSLELIMAAI